MGDTLRTARARAMYEEVAQRRLAGWRQSTERHAEAQVRARNREQAERRRSLAEQDAIRAGAADDPDGFAAGMMTMLAEVQGRSARDGLQAMQRRRPSVARSARSTLGSCGRRRTPTLWRHRPISMHTPRRSAIRSRSPNCAQCSSPIWRSRRPIGSSTRSAAAERKAPDRPPTI